jgi:Flp pilus assembly protein TadG
MTIRRAGRRRGVTTVEMAFVTPFFVLLIFGLIVGGLGVFRYNELATLSREGSRYASVRGMDYQQRTGNPAATAESIHAEAVLPRAIGLDTSRLSTTASWDKSKYPRQMETNGTITTNYVTVTVTYRWRPEIFFGGEIVMSSTSRMPMSY